MRKEFDNWIPVALVIVLVALLVALVFGASLQDAAAKEDCLRRGGHWVVDHDENMATAVGDQVIVTTYQVDACQEGRR